MSANYKESTVSGTAYVRCHRITVENELDFKMATFNEENVVTTDAGVMSSPIRNPVSKELKAEELGNTFPILNPETGEDTGAVASYGETYALLHSLYLHVAQERDVEELKDGSSR